MDPRTLQQSLKLLTAALSKNHEIEFTLTVRPKSRNTRARDRPTDHTTTDDRPQSKRQDDNLTTTPMPPVLPILPPEAVHDTSESFRLLAAAGVDQDVALDLARRYTPDRVQAVIAASTNPRLKVRNVPGYIRTALEKGWRKYA